MTTIFIDESGSMTKSYARDNPYFVIALLCTNEPQKLRRIYKRFVSSRIGLLKKNDVRHEMFRDDKFCELKGNSFTKEAKCDFVEFFCRNPLFRICYIVVDNSAVQDKLYKNTSRAFNYILKLALESLLNAGQIDRDGITLQLDERNERTETKHFLQQYLNTELYLSGKVDNEISVQYYDSKNNKLIQVADVFANLKYSMLMTREYRDEYQKMWGCGCLVKEFKFPL